MGKEIGSGWREGGKGGKDKGKGGEEKAIMEEYGRCGGIRGVNPTRR
jgi:hypothetical protein